jgi:hypothetical protein
LVAVRSSAGVAHALREGIARAAAAPAILVGVFLVVRVLDVPSTDLSPLAGPDVRHLILTLLCWSFAYGGILDRYARNRATRGRGFFAACGAHVMPLGRLAVFVLVASLVVPPEPPVEWPLTTPGSIAWMAGLAVVTAVLAFARVRLVVEDRRSAAGALLGGIRFVRRNPAGTIIFALYIVVTLGLGTGLTLLLPRLIGTVWLVRTREAFLLLQVFLHLAAYASATVLFQSRLAHAEYTAAPPLVWPDSPAAEAIVNAAPTRPS